MAQLQQVQVTRYIRGLRGGTQPMLAGASDGYAYVVKFTNNLQGQQVLFNEGAGSEMYRACGLSGAHWSPLFVSDGFLDRNRDCWMRTADGLRRPEPGLCFGSRFLGGDGQRLFEILPGSNFTRIPERSTLWLAWLIDICCEHADNHQAVFVEDGERQLHAQFIDHGHMFGGPHGLDRPRPHASSYLDPRVYPDLLSSELTGFLRRLSELDTDRLVRQVNDLPDDWKSDSALGCFERCIDRLSTESLLRNVLDEIEDIHRRRTRSERSRRCSELECELPFLRPRIPSKPLGRCGAGAQWAGCGAAG